MLVVITSTLVSRNVKKHNSAATNACTMYDTKLWRTFTSFVDNRATASVIKRPQENPNEANGDIGLSLNMVVASGLPASKPVSINER